MRIGITIGTVTLVEPHPAVRGGVFRLVVPVGPQEIARVAAGGPATGPLASGPLAAEPLVAWDDLGCGPGQIVAFSEGGEAAQPFRPLDRPVDAFIAAILDRIDLPPREAGSA
jgi:hypothetical protein